MTTFILALFDCAGIQQYIFGGNRLQESVGASEKVERAITYDIDIALRKAVSKGLAPTDAWKNEPEDLKILDDSIDAEILYQGGGNAAVLFRHAIQAQKCLEAWSESLLRFSPGMVPVATLVEFDSEQGEGESGSLELALHEAHCGLAELKRSRTPSLRLQGISVNATCVSTGLAASEWDRNKQEWISSEADAKRKAFQDANQRLQAYFQPYLLEGYQFLSLVKRLCTDSDILKLYKSS